ncbi:DNA damage-inducible protein D [Peptoclostridium sp. AF21-18]|uniref:DNA damage-inducible protein D n=1 Tax=Peptoclostridium sp. AF21-18 TaxID=2292243 RepID=UPI000E47628D|nr:DNA damage-inducible protein D [Peptoclostridium sp. AF21-18]RHQ97413.1 DNA damage-inducible protein D [Peptoclostridium sp. AF21-18]
MNDIENYNDIVFEKIKQIDENGVEFWYARDLQLIFEYREWRNFTKVIDKAKEACLNSGLNIIDHFIYINKNITLSNNATRKIEDIKLTRYACYLIVQNSDPRKSIVALGQTYFSMQTRKQELQENFDSLSEEQKRLAIRKDLKEHNKHLVNAASDAGVKTAIDYARFQNFGYKGLYGGLDAKGIHTKKGLEKNQKILDHMGSTELAANLFRATQTEDKLRREEIKGKENANNTHFEVGKVVRNTIKELGGTMPEDLPTPTKSIKELEKEEKQKKKIKK